MNGGAPDARRTREEDVKQVDVLAMTLLVVGALNWGLVAVARFDLVAAVFGMEFGETSSLTALVYGLVGLAGLCHAVAWKAMQRRSHSATLATR